MDESVLSAKDASLAQLYSSLFLGKEKWRVW